jgi:RNA polymerase sigma factor (sigma-70 family)
MPDADLQRDEAQLRAAVLEGNAWAWRTLFDRHFGALYGYVLFRSGRDRMWAEDVIQETWLKAARGMEDFDPTRGGFEGWLKGIAENQLRNQRRREAYRRTAPLSEATDVTAKEISHAAAYELEDGVALTFAALSPAHQAVLRAKYEEQLPTAEIAAQWGATPKSVESLLSRARAAFRDAFRQLCGETEDR